MFKAWFFLISLILISSKNYSQNTAIPDNNFEQALIDLGLDTPPLNNLVPTNNIIGVIDLDVKGKNIQDITGIEDFLALSNLDCSDNQLSLLNISQNTNLIEVYCSNNQLSFLNIGNLTNLVRLWCFSNQLQSLDVTLNSKLISLRCETNNLSRLETSNLLNLNILTCEENQLNTINVSSNTGLARLQCGNNMLSSLDVSNNSSLTYLACEQNLLTSLNTTSNTNLKVVSCSNNQIRTLNLSENVALTDLDCSHNQLCQLMVNNGNNSNLTTINFSNNQDLNCVVVDNSNGNHSTWLPTSFLNYVNSNEACSRFVPVDTLDDFIGRTYTLPFINNGNYFTQSDGNGLLLNNGNTITTSQTIYIYNELNCYSNESNFNVIITDSNYFIPKYFTPNNDGFNDVWIVFDYAKSINNVSIFNRHGKLLKFISGNSLKWDGNFNGEAMNTDSYWYEVVLNSGDVLRGYFALKR